MITLETVAPRVKVYSINEVFPLLTGALTADSVAVVGEDAFPFGVPSRFRERSAGRRRKSSGRIRRERLSISELLRVR